MTKKRINPLDNDIQEIFLSHEDIVTICAKLGKRISKDYEGKTPLLIGLLRGCVPFLAELIKHLTIHCEYDFLEVESYFGGTVSTHAVTIKRDLTSDIVGRNLIIVDDIIDTGLTLKTICKMLEDKGAASIEIATLLNKPAGRNVIGADPKYIGTEIPNAFVVGFGLDYQQKYRNLPYIGILKPHMYQKDK